MTLCKLLGCRLNEFGWSCERCMACLYSLDFVHRSEAWLDPWFRTVWWFHVNRRWIYHTCDVCGNPLAWTEDACCSEDCYDKWTPF